LPGKDSDPRPADLPADLQAALDLAPCGLLRTDALGTIDRVNATFCEWTGYRREDLVGRRFSDLLTVGGRIFHQTHLVPLVQIQGSVAEVKLDLRRADGTVVPMVLNARRHETPQGTFSEVAVFVARDRDTYERELLASRKRLEQLVAEAQALQADAKDRALFAEQMMGIVSHDLRNPLSTIHMGAHLLERMDARPQQLSVLGRITRATDRAHRLIVDLLDFTQARLGTGLHVSMKPIRPHAAVADAVDELGQAFPGRELVHLRIGEGECTGDADRLAQLVGNLVANAMAYGQADMPVTVRSEVGDARFTISVHNHGTPIPLEAQSRIFRPLTRGAHEGSSVRSVGLGLYIVSEIAKAHGGHVTVSSGAEGTLFTATMSRRLSASPGPAAD
jgi:sigma-B regulation protein RsbU (phosphoserine phosphatase)